MESVVIDRRAKWKSLKQRLGVKAMGCCGAAWSPRPRISTISILDEDEDDETAAVAAAAAAAAQGQQAAGMMGRSGNAVVISNRIHSVADQNSSGSLPLLAGQGHHHHQQQQQVVVGSGSGSGMNLAMALAAERNSRATNNVNVNVNVSVGPSPTDQQQQVKTLMRLIEETDGVDWKKQQQQQQRKDDNNNDNNVEEVSVGVVVGGCDWVCCVCMERKKGAAFIPCGHAFCRVCSREVWVNRASCPVCNRNILDILDLF